MLKKRSKILSLFFPLLFTLHYCVLGHTLSVAVPQKSYATQNVAFSTLLDISHIIQVYYFIMALYIWIYFINYAISTLNVSVRLMDTKRDDNDRHCRIDTPYILTL